MNSRDLSIDLIKVVAMYGVMTLHTNADNLDNVIGFSIYSLATASVPLFFSVSGYLLLHRDIDYKYSWRKIYGIIRLCFIVGITYYLLDCLTGLFKVENIFLAFPLSLLQKGPFAQFWYLGAMILVYLMLPLKVYVLRSNKLLQLWLVGLLLLIQLVFVLNVTCRFEENVTQTFRIWNWIFYVILGGGHL